MERVLITGASRGIGRAIALELARAGFEIALNYRARAEAAQAVADEIAAAGGRARLLPFDVSERAAAARAIEADIAAHGAYWGVVLNAGVTADGPLAGMSGEDWDRVLRTNLDGFYNVLQPLLMPLVRLRRGGRVLTLSSVSGLMANRGQVNYSASKAGLIGATRSLAAELASRGIAVNCIAPGLIETEMLAGAPVEELAQRIPMKRLGKPEEVAALAGFLFGPGASYLTGQVISVNGGLV
jgi:3-oxoacyl-[acyl-carrier protein] reductase